MKEMGKVLSKTSNRRSFLKNGTVAVGAATVGVSLLGKATPAFAREEDGDRAPITRGDIAILKFLQALEQVEAINSKNWHELIPMTPLTAGYVNTSRSFFKINNDKVYTHIRLNIFPDGGIARLRVYGEVLYEINLINPKEIDLVAMKHGGVCQSYSNAHYGHPKNLISPGTSKNMGDGWETARRLDRPPILKADEHNILQVPGNEWAIFKFGCVGKIDEIQIDTTHFKGNYPDSAKIEGGIISNEKIVWKTILPTSKLSAHTTHMFANGDLTSNGPFSHVRVTIMPDGGISRLRIYGKPVSNHLKY